jgi:hypothetical protein
MIGADPKYLKSIYDNLMAARPDDCRSPKA